MVQHTAQVWPLVGVCYHYTWNADHIGKEVIKQEERCCFPPSFSEDIIAVVLKFYSLIYTLFRLLEIRNKLVFTNTDQFFLLLFKYNI